MGTRQRGRLLIVSGMTALLMLVGAQAVAAHARLVSSDPADTAIVNKAPAQVLLTFSQETSPTKSGGSVLDAGGTTVSIGFKVDLNDRTKMTIDLKPNLPNGAYTVKWNTLTEDDNGMADGTFTFTIQAAAAGGSAVAATAATGSASPLPPAPTPSATVAPTATRAATTAAPTDTGGGSAATGAATRPPATLPSAGNAEAGSNPPWVLVLVIAAVLVVAAGFALRLRLARR